MKLGPLQLICLLALTSACGGGAPPVALANPGAQASASGAVAQAPVNPQSFAAWLGGFKRSAAEAGIRQTTIDTAFAGVQPNPRIIELNNRQPEFSRTTGDYLASAVSDTRVANGRRLLAEHGALLESVSRRYGVPPQYVVAIWGLESDYGRDYGSYYAIEALATLAADGPRVDYGRRELLSALRILDNGDVTRDRLLGSWAGAMGQTQFIPSTYLAEAVDFDGDGRRDLWTSLADAFASTASYLDRVGGWEDGMPWGTEVLLPADFDWEVADLSIRRPVAQWMGMGVRAANGAPLPGQGGDASIILPAGHSGPAFLVLDNFRAIMRYNNSSSYALAVSHLADRIAGGAPFVARWPADDAPLSRDDRLDLQRLLAESGYDPGGFDGLVGPNTRQAVRGFQKEIGVPADGYPTPELLRRLRTGSAG
ncbi:MAG: lytic murein transglycosylase [Inquilinaceae bacterium]